MQESDTYLMILDKGQAIGFRKGILIIGEELFGPPKDPVKSQLNNITALDRLQRMVRRAATAESWQEILNTP